MADNTNKAQQMFNERNKSEKIQETTLLEIKEAILLNSEIQKKHADRVAKFEENQLAIQEEELKLRKMEVSRNRFSRLKAGAGLVGAGAVGAYGVGKAMVKFDAQRQKSFARIAIAEMVAAGAITAITAAVIGHTLFKRLFDNTTKEQKTLARAAAAAVKAPAAFKGGKKIANVAGDLIADMKKPGVGFKQSVKNLGADVLKTQFDKYVTSQVKSIKNTYTFLADQAKVAGSAFVKGGGAGIASNLAEGAGKAPTSVVGKGVMEGVTRLRSSRAADVARAGLRAVDDVSGAKSATSVLSSQTKTLARGAMGLGIGGTAKAVGGGLVKGGAAAGLALGKGALTGAGKLVAGSAKTIGKKVAAKFIPGLGAAFSLYSGIDRWKRDDKVGAYIDFSSAVANLIPGIGGFVSLGLDLINMGRDFKSMSVEQQQTTLQKGRAYARHIPGLGLGISIVDSIKMFSSGDIRGGIQELIGGITSTIPGGRWAFDAGLELVEAFHGAQNPMSGTAETIKKVSKEQMKNMPIIGTFLRMKDAFKLYDQGKTSEAMIEGAKALGTMIPGVGLLYNFFEEASGDKQMALPSSSAIQAGRGTISKKEGKAKLGKLRKAIIAGQAAGKDVSALEARRDSLVTQMQNNGVPKVDEINGIKHTKVGISDADMDNVQWDKLGGRSTIEKAILGVWNSAGIEGQPTFTSGYRDPAKNAELALANPNSKHLTGMAFDLRGKDIPEGKKGIVASKLREAFGKSGYSVYPHGEGDNFHYHLQWPAPSMDEAKATAMLEARDPYYAAKGAVFDPYLVNRPIVAGEAGPEAIIPLNDQGIGVIAQAMNKSLNINSVQSPKATKTTEEFKTFLVDTFAKALASEIAKATGKNKSSQEKTAPAVKVF